MRVLLMAHNYPPDEASGAQRVHNVADALRRSGMRVRVLTSGESTTRGRVVDGVRVDRVRPLPDGTGLLRLLARVRRHVPVTSADGEAAPDPREAVDSGSALRRSLISILRFMGGDTGFVLPALWAALERPLPDVIYTSAPPMSGHLAGLLAHAMTGRPWVMEYRDPWMVDGNPHRAPDTRSAFTDALERLLYRKCLGAASEVVAVSHGIADQIAPDRATLGRSPPHVILNGIPSLAVDPGPRRDGPLRILHLGTLYAFRDPGPFFEALAAGRERAGWTAETLEVRFVGPAPEAPVLDHVARLGLTDLVRFEGWVDHAEGQRLVEDADLLLIFAQRQPLQIPNKLYEYLGSRKPILAFVDAEGETADLLRRSRGGTLVTEREGPARVDELVREALERAAAPPTVPGSDVEARLAGWTTEAQLAGLAGIVRLAASTASTSGPSVATPYQPRASDGGVP